MKKENIKENIINEIIDYSKINKENIKENIINEIIDYSKINKENIKENIINEIIDYSKININKIKKEIYSNNISLVFNDNIGTWGEYLSTILYPFSFSCASKGGCAFDNIENNIIREIKTCCRIQPKKCNNCNNKIAYFIPKCYICNNKKFKYIKDSRFNINVKDFFNNEIKEFLFFIIDIEYKTNDIIKNPELVDIIKNPELVDIKYTCFKLYSNNNWFKTLLYNQYTYSNSNGCNILPYSFDFYCSGVIKLFEININIETKKENIIYFNLDNNIYEDIPLNILKKEEYLKIPDICKNYDEKIKYIIHRNKNYNKKRGIINKNNYLHK